MSGFRWVRPSRPAESSGFASDRPLGQGRLARRGFGAAPAGLNRCPRFRAETSRSQRAASLLGTRARRSLTASPLADSYTFLAWPRVAPRACRSASRWGSSSLRAAQRVHHRRLTPVTHPREFTPGLQLQWRGRRVGTRLCGRGRLINHRLRTHRIITQVTRIPTGRRRKTCPTIT
jgi:hypothetical protein